VNYSKSIYIVITFVLIFPSKKHKRNSSVERKINDEISLKMLTIDINDDDICMNYKYKMNLYYYLTIYY